MPSRPWQHQVRTYTRFLSDWPSRVLIADEVGLGKTISAGLILRQAILSGLAKRVLILTPKSVQIQWQNELYEKFNLNVPIYDGSALVWRAVHGARSAVEKPVGRDEWQAEPVVLVSSFLMRRADRQRELLDAADWDLLILDEAHHARRRGAGSTQEKGPNALLGLMRKLQEKCRLAPSADGDSDAGTSCRTLGSDGFARACRMSGTGTTASSCDISNARRAIPLPRIWNTSRRYSARQRRPSGR